MNSDTPLKLQIRRANGQPFNGPVDIRVFDLMIRAEAMVRVGADASRDIDVIGVRPEGRYQVMIAPGGRFRPQEQAVELPPTGTTTLTFFFQEEAESTMVPPTAPPVAPTLPNRYAVEGTIASVGRVLVGGLDVQIIDKNVGPEVLLASVKSDDRGHYYAEFDAAAFRQRKAKPDLQVRVLKDTVPIGASDIRYDASEHETIDATLTVASSAALPPEHTALLSAIGAHYQAPLHLLQENDDRQDITYLANKTGWDARAVAMASLAQQFNLQHGDGPGNAIRPELYYALFRSGLPAHPTALFKTDAKTVQRIWRKSIDDGVLPREMAGHVDDAVNSWSQLAGRVRLAAEPPSGVSTLGQILNVSGLAEEQQRQFGELLTRHGDDADAFWQAVKTQMPGAADRLEVDGKLATLTINNAAVMSGIHDRFGDLRDPEVLAQAGLHDARAWTPYLHESTPIPKEIPGASDDERRRNYAAYLAAQVRISYPTASIAQMYGTSIPDANNVQQFLLSHRDEFVVGAQPVEQFINRKGLAVAQGTVDDLKRLQRIQQITPTDQAMTAILSDNKIHSAFDVVRQPRETFVAKFAADLGGTATAEATYDKALEVHNTTLNIAVAFLQARNGITVGLKPGDYGVILPEPTKPTGANAKDIVAYPTLENLFGSMDYCACDHCRSVLSPAAYLVDLLQFIDQTPPAGSSNPQDVLFDRRPDIQHLPLTCENTNTAMKYIDVVNETMEYFIANGVQKLSLRDYKGHDTNGLGSADLMATPQFVIDGAYDILQNEPFPPPLPFHKSLETLRACFDQFEVPLPLAMERLRKSEKLDDAPYGWRDILLEGLRISRTEAALLCKSATFGFRRLYGFPTSITDDQAIAQLSNAKAFARRMGISYQDLVDILRTRFVNPSSDLLPRLQHLTTPIKVIMDLKTIGDAAAIARFDASLPTGGAALDPRKYGGDIHAWVTDDDNYKRILNLIVLSNPKPDGDVCDFGKLELRHAQVSANETDVSNRLKDFEFVRIIRFIRLWKKLGWTVEQTDAAICALWNDNGNPLSDGDVDSLAKLDSHFDTLLPRLGVMARVMTALGLSADGDLLPLLACWSTIGTNGEHSFYRQLFLNPSIHAEDAVFEADKQGRYLAAGETLVKHAEVVRAALSLTGSEYDDIIRDLGLGAPGTILNLTVVSNIFRQGWLARQLRMSVRELQSLRDATGIDPFARPDLSSTPPELPPILRFIELVQTLRDRGVKTEAALYLVWNVDLSGKSAPDSAAVAELARALRGEFADIESQFLAAEDPEGNLARARTALVYGEETTKAFFQLLDDGIEIDVPYDEFVKALDDAMKAKDQRISNDTFQKRLRYRGLLTATNRDALKNLAEATSAFRDAVDALFTRSDDAQGSFFTRHPELKKPFNDYVTSVDPPEKKRAALLAALQPELAALRKRQQTLQRVSAAAGSELPMTAALLDGAAAPFPLHAAGDKTKPALEDFLALEKPGLTIDAFDPVTNQFKKVVAASAVLDYNSVGNPLPNNGAAFTAKWRGRIETAEAGYHNFIIEADAAVTQVKLSIGGTSRTLAHTGNLWRNHDAIDLKGGALYDFELQVDHVKDALSVKWETPKRAREVIPGRYLWTAESMAPFTASYTRFLKAIALAEALSLTPKELAHFATVADDQINGDGWLNALPVDGLAGSSTGKALLDSFRSLLDFARIKEEVAAGDEQVLDALTPPGDAVKLMHWDPLSVTALLAHFVLTAADLRKLRQFSRIYGALAITRAVGVAAGALTAAVTNEPSAAAVRDFQSALRGRYAAADWLAVIEPINDKLRAMQRDALVAYILHQFRSADATKHIDTPDKLFEYFLMDVQMEPCMQTSRIRHALSSVQLFIERCLMNLETQVSASSIDGKQWQWMKRYRVWEANRKVFLFPENWLAPELRDDKSSFFKEIESELLQSDITEDSATTALLNYLAKLEEVAKLEPCGICHVPGDPQRKTSDIEHVVARTQGAHRKYFYRRREGLTWTAWEQIKAEIEDNPILPVAWNDRLLLFWLRVTKESSQNTPALSRPASGKIGDLTQSSLPSAPEVRVKAILSWSEYYNGKWQAAKTSEPSEPMELGTDPVWRSSFGLRAHVEGDGSLRIVVDQYGTIKGGFLLFNTHSRPLLQDSSILQTANTRSIDAVYSWTWIPMPWPLPPFPVPQDYSIRASYAGTNPSAPISHDLERPVAYDSVPVVTRQPYSDWDDPFFLVDSQHSFFVTVQREQVPVWDIPIYTYIGPNYSDFITPPSLVLRKPELTVPPKRGWEDGGPIGPDPIIGNRGAVERFVSEDAYIRNAIPSAVSIDFGNVKIGPAGSFGRKN